MIQLFPEKQRFYVLERQGTVTQRETERQLKKEIFHPLVHSEYTEISQQPGIPWSLPPTCTSANKGSIPALLPGTWFSNGGGQDLNQHSKTECVSSSRRLVHQWESWESIWDMGVPSEGLTHCATMPASESNYCLKLYLDIFVLLIRKLLCKDLC